MAKIPSYDRRKITTVLSDAGVPIKAIALLDTKYVMMADAHAADFFFKLSTQVISTLGGWRSDFRDCDKFSRVLQSLMLLDHALSWDKTGEPAAALTIGVFNYVQDKGGAHSINCIITKESKKDVFRVRFFEPQTARELPLTDKEIKSAFLVLL